MTSRAFTDMLPLSCQPAPDSDDITLGAKAPKTPSTSSQATSTTPEVGARPGAQTGQPSAACRSLDW